MWQVANTLLVSGIACLVLGCVIAAVAGFMITREGIGDSFALSLAWSVGVSVAGIVLGGGFLMTVTGLAFMWTTRWDDDSEEPSEIVGMEDE